MADGIQITEVDGVPAVFARYSGPMTAGLVFRVGQADETLARRGVTHLVEHLALHRTGLADYHYNGVTGATTTTFHMQGSEQDVLTFLGEVCAGLHDLPLDRVETEKELLRTERAGRDRPANASLPLWRYGARGYGLVSYPEFGLPALGEAELVHWARTWFTKENAVLWISGSDLPAGLTLPLPTGGARRPLPVAHSALPVTPAFFVGGAKGVVLDALVPRGAAATVFTRVLDRELFRALRQDGGYSYQASAAYESRDNEIATVTALADALPDQVGAVLGGTIDVLMKLRLGRIEPGDIEATRAQASDATSHPDIEVARLPAYATSLLTGSPLVPTGQYLADLEAVTADDVHRVAGQAFESVLLMTPEGHGADWAGFTAAPTASEALIEDGRKFPMLGTADSFLALGPAGVSTAEGEHLATVRFDACAAMLAWPDGGRQLVGYDGIAVQVEPSLVAIDPTVGAAIDEAIDGAIGPATVVQMPARGPEEIPKPPVPEPGQPGLPGPVPPGQPGPVPPGQPGPVPPGQPGSVPAGQLVPGYPPYSPAPNPQVPFAQVSYGAPGPGMAGGRTGGTWRVLGRIALIGLTVLMIGLSAVCTGLSISGSYEDAEAQEGGWILAGMTWVCLVVCLIPTVVVVLRMIRESRSGGGYRH